MSPFDEPLQDPGAEFGGRDALVEHVAREIVVRGLAGPAVGFLQASRPYRGLDASAMLFFDPVLHQVFGGEFAGASAILADDDVMGVFQPGDHGSTFGGNPLGCAVARTALKVLVEEGMIENAASMGEYFQERLAEINSPHVKEVRGKGLLIGVELYPQVGGARRFCEALQTRGVLAKETRIHVIRFAPPLIITRQEVDWALERVQEVLTMP